MGPDALLRAAAEKLDHRRPVAEVRLGGGFPAEAVNSKMPSLPIVSFKMAQTVLQLLKVDWIIFLLVN